jgi:ribosomal protein S5
MKTLFFVPRYRSATILHPVTGHYGKCKVIMNPRSTGSGCKASHMISSICNLAGIQDIGVKVRGC